MHFSSYLTHFLYFSIDRHSNFCYNRKKEVTEMEENENFCGFSPMWDRFRAAEHPISTMRRYTEKKYNENLHFHDFPQIWYCAKGEYTHTVGDETFFCSAGSLIIVPSGVPHRFEIADEGSCILYQTNLLFNLFRNFSELSELQCAVFTFLPAFSRELRFEVKKEYILKDEEKAAADAVFNKLYEFDSSKSPRTQSSYKNLFFSLFTFSAFSLSDKARLRAEKFIREKFIPLLRTVYHMNINFGNKILREELVELSGLCQTDYFRYIKRIVGTTFSTYLQRLRVRHAIVLATFSPYSLSYIADICGFGDLSYMENRIKKYTEKKRLPRDMRRDRKDYIKTFPLMIMTRDNYEAIPKFFYEL